ncbi:MAG TPA: bacillithiol biosynthesis cysteine-adding enzyme BshC [bacterium]|nr:bacillithiol biosynthesis cysteine-adding enzyme BshC [bacterium]HPN42607.1 bacillithiol biosynthesis cysteine-adding enzyme BshC [bacterium]
MTLAIEKIPGLSKLATDYLGNPEKVQLFFNGDYRQWDNYKRVTGQAVKTPRPFMPEFIEILLEQNKTFGCPQSTLEHIAALRRPDTLVVATGQQTGLFSGPLYTIYKALTTIKLARELSGRLGVNVLPVFYLVSEDHDFVEVSDCGFIDKENKYSSLHYQPDVLAERIPVAQVILEEKITNLISQFADSLTDSEFKSGIFSALRECYAPGIAYHTAFARWFTRLFAGYGIILFDAADPRYKPFVAPVFARELQENITVAAMRQTGAELEQAGYHQQLAVQPGRPALFLLKNGRHSLEQQGADYKLLSTGEILTIAELLQTPQNLSPKAALRPLIQDTLFPTVAYVGGPGEIAYWAQLRRVYTALNLTMPVVYPRAAFTLVEPKIQRHLQRFALTPQECIADPQGAAERVMRALLPTDMTQQFETLKSNLQRDLQTVRDKITATEPTLQPVVDKTLLNITGQLEGLENKVMKAVEQRGDVAAGQVRTVMENLAPGQSLQERKLNITPYLVKYDWSFLEVLYQAVEIGSFKHKLLEL